MSTSFHTDVRCGHCGHAFQAVLYSNLHVTRAPEVRAAILADDFQVFVCPDCGGRVRVEPTLLYTDFDRWQWLAVFPRRAISHRSHLARLVEAGFRDNMTIAAPPMVKSWAPRFTRRVVFGLPALREKLLCFEQGLDDRLLEVFKLCLARDAAPEAIHPHGILVLEAGEVDGLVFRVAAPPGADGTQVFRRISVPLTALRRLEDRRDELAERFSTLFDGPVVDWQAALHPDRPMPTPPHPAPTPPWRALGGREAP